MLRRFAVLFMLVIAAASLARAESPTEAVGSFSWMDATDSDSRAMAAGFDLTVPIGKRFAAGPVFRYDYVRFADRSVTETIIFQSIAPETMPQPPQVYTYRIKIDGGIASVWSFGGRAAFHFAEDHDGVYLALEALFPQDDAEGYIAAPELGIQWALGGALARVAYRRPLHFAEEDGADLDAQQVTFGFGGRF